MRFEAEAVLFDSDGVLVDSHLQVVEYWTALATEFGLDIDRLLTELVGVRAVDTLSRYLSPADTAAASARLEERRLGLAPWRGPASRCPTGSLPPAT